MLALLVIFILLLMFMSTGAHWIALPALVIGFVFVAFWLVLLKVLIGFGRWLMHAPPERPRTFRPGVDLDRGRSRPNAPLQCANKPYAAVWPAPPGRTSAH